MLKIAICDDELYFGEQMKSIISNYMEKVGQECKITSFESEKTFLSSNPKKLDYDIVFLDINMKEMNGIEIAQAIRTLSNTIYIVFVTAYINFALEGYKFHAIRYILKDNHNLKALTEECLNAILKEIEENEKKITFKFTHGKVDLAPSKILYIESQLHNIIFFIIDNGIIQYVMHNKLNNVEITLKPYKFFRIHQSYLVNMNYIKDVTRYQASLFNGIELNISKKYYKKVLEEYIKIKGDI